MHNHLYLIVILIGKDVILSLQSPSPLELKLDGANGTVNSTTEIHDMDPPITLDKVKVKLKQLEIFDCDDPTLTKNQRIQLETLLDTIQFMMTSRSRQPDNVQSTFSSLRLVQKTVEREVRRGRVTKALASKFKWNNLSMRRNPKRPMYRLDKQTNMRVFYVDN